MSGPVTQDPVQSGPPRGGRGRQRAGGAAAHSVRIGRLLGVPLEVHWSFLFLVVLVVAGEWPAGAGAITGGLVFLGALFACVVVHELAHCLVARRRGGAVLGILLLPIGGMSRMERIPDRSADEAAIAAIGPATSLVLGGTLLSIGALLGSSVWPPTLLAGSWWARLGWLNVLLAAFNLLPALPMDGGRVLRAALARRLPRLAATRVAASVAKVVAVGLVVLGLLYDIWFVFIGVFVFLGASGEESLARAEELARRQPPGWGWGGWYAPPGFGRGGIGPTRDLRGGYPPPQGPDAGEGGRCPPPPGTWVPGTWWAPPGQAPPWGQAWSPPWGQEPGPRERSAIDVAVEGGSPDAGGREPRGERVGEHD